ncbi:hypothetical protein TKK_0006047 [Trichogramma kaykai]
MKFFKNNTTTHYVTQLSQPIRLVGNWSVALTEIHIPLTFQHISYNSRDGFVGIEDIKNNNKSDLQIIKIGNITENMIEDSYNQTKISYVVRPGIYKSIEKLLNEINELPHISSHLQLSENPGQYIQIKRICGLECCLTHIISFSEKLYQILGFENSTTGITLEEKDIHIGTKPANLKAASPQTVMIYTDIIEPIFTGDIQARLLRSTSINGENHSYGFTHINRFSPAMYIPLLYNSFQTIEIDIRDQHGLPLPFDSGTLTAILHFKRLE